MIPSRVVTDLLGDRPGISLHLQSAGLLSTLVFLVSSIYEVLFINSLHQSQYFLIAILLGVLSAWALLEVVCIGPSSSRAAGLKTLRILLAVQIGLIAVRHWQDFIPDVPVIQTGSAYAIPELGASVVFLPIYLLLFLAINRCLIDLFATAERLRANQLQQKMLVLRQTEAELQASESRYRNFFNLPLVGTAIISPRQDWIAVNPTTCGILGYSRQELCSLTWSQLTHPDDVEAECLLFERVLQGEIKGYQIEKRFIRKDGKIVHVLMAGGRGPVGPEQPNLFHMNLIDISDRKRVEAELALAQDRQKALEAKQRRELEQKLKTSLTASAVVHEIQQPLATILLTCRLAEETLRSLPRMAIPEALRSQLAQLMLHGEQLTATMERMRMLLRNVETQPTPLDLSTNIDSALIYLRRDLLQHQIAVTTVGLEHPCPLLGDGAQLQNATVNLIRNAIEAMLGQPPVSRRLSVELHRRVDHLEIRIEDSGPGFVNHENGSISWELLKSSRASGMGIGLFLAQTAAINHGGELRIGRGAELGGALVTLAMPWRQPPAH